MSKFLFPMQNLRHNLSFTNCMTKLHNMESKISLKDRLRRTRSVILSFGSQKHSAQKSDGYPYFRGPAIQRQSSISERQSISRSTERELRNACCLLQRNIAHGVPSTDNNQNADQQVVPNRTPSSRVRPQSNALPVVLQAATQPRDPAPPAPIPAQAPEPAQDQIKAPERVRSLWRNVRPYREHNYDADPWHQWSGIAIPEGPQGQVQSNTTSRIPSSSMKSARDAVIEMPFSSGETLVAGADFQQDRRAYIRVPADIQDDPESEGNEEKEHEKKHSTNNNDKNDDDDTSPSSLEGSSRLVRKKRIENLHESVREGTAPTSNDNDNSNSNSNTTSVSVQSPITPRPSATRARYSWLPRTGIRPASTIETGSPRRVHEPVTITTSSTTSGRTGIRLMVVNDEEQVRQHDLQEAIWEKMATGRISTRSKLRPMSTAAMPLGMDDMPLKPTTTTTKDAATGTFAAANVTVNRRAVSQPLACRDMSHKHKSAFPASVPVPEPGAGLPAEKFEPGINTFQQPMKRRSIMRKLAFLGFGKQKNKETPAVGYSQIVC